jgi:type 1 fimbria pilin
MVRRMIKVATAAVLLLGSAALAAAATPQCLRGEDVEAEQAIRFQTELMVVSDTCGAQTYTTFARRNRDALVDYQQAIIERFRRAGVNHAEARFDSYLTQLANEVSLRVGAQPVATMCHDAASFLATAESLAGDQFRRYVAEQAAAGSGDRRCRE